jgi:hypothetical protein
MVSVSTVLLEIHWLTTPAPQSKPAVQASAPPPRPKVEGPSAALSPVYPKKLEPAQPAPSTQNNVQNTVDTATTSNAAVKAEPAQKPVAETTGAAPRSDDRSKTQNAVSPDSAHNAQAYAAQPKPADPERTATSNNQCDVQACASAYKSFRASDCTYQPFGGLRRVCGKAPEQRAEQRADREQRNEPQRRSWSRREDLEDSRDTNRRTRWRVYDEDDDEDDVILFRRSPRW